MMATRDHEGQRMMELAIRPGYGATAKPCLLDCRVVSLVPS